MEDDPRASWQLLRDHLHAVGASAAALAKLARPEDERFIEAARAAGLLHDFGKYSQEFQELIRGKRKRAEHSGHGASLAAESKAWEIAFAIAGHHAGIPNFTGGLRERVKQWAEAALALKATAAADCPELEIALAGSSGPKRDVDLRTRMLFSCLVDADRLDTGGFEVQQAPLAAAERLHRLKSAIANRAAGIPEGAVKSARRKVLDSCLIAAEAPGGIFSLTVPTGGGKTFSSMAFALRRAALFPELYRRIIVVIPYLSIIEQNAQAFIEALGAGCILEHHSGNVNRLKPRDSETYTNVESQEGEYEHPGSAPPMENWDAPIIVTTSVRFFESLFSNRPRDLRRLHNVARSIVIVDEVQTLPRQFLGLILGMMQDLAKDWSTCFLLCTATQPALERGPQASKHDMRWLAGTVREIVEEPAALFRDLQRVTVSWPGDRKTSWPEIAQDMVERRRALCIVNIRDHASNLYRELHREAQARGLSQDGIFHLSTRMCAAHRLAVLAKIRNRLADESSPCLVASTQLVEAGVDLDFPVVYRALGPLDSIIQAAGRCDREGKLTEALGRPGGHMIVFRPEDEKTPPGAYREATERTRVALARGPISIDDPAAVREYFDRYYGDGADLGKQEQNWRDELAFRSLAQAFEMISDLTQAVFIGYDAMARAVIEELLARGRLDREILRALQRYTVGLYPGEFFLARQGVIQEVRPDSDLWVCQESCYDESLGLVLDRTASEMVI